MWRHIASNAVTFLVVAVFLLGGVVLWGQNQYTAEGPLDQAICLQVQPGSNMRRVSEDLAAQGAVSSSAIFRIGADYQEKTQDLKAGSFLVEPGTSMAGIVDQVTRGGASTCGTEVVYRIGVNRLSVQVRELDPAAGRFVERAEFEPGEEETPAVYAEKKAEADTRFRIALAEGVTSWQVINALETVDVLEGEAGDVPPEGSLAPDSYEVRKGDDRAALVARMAEAQERRVAEAWEARDADLPVESPEELLILASIIEKETAVAAERRAIAGVFTRRLKIGMRLQTDPTVIYGMGERYDGNIRRRDLREATPYNTYVIAGLPPTPIALPGRAALLAAVDPLPGKALYFVSRNDGTHVFSATLAEHERAVDKYQRGL